MGQALRLASPDESHRRFGVPVGGAFDRSSARAGVHLVGGTPFEQWEIYGSAEFLVSRGGVVACTGAEQEIRLDGVRQWKRSCFAVTPGAVLRVVGRNRDAARLYLTVGADAAGELSWSRSYPSAALRFVPGPDAVDLGFTGWRVTPNSDRIGMRLVGPAQPHSVELPSRPTTVGSIQVPPDGNPIILGPDGPTVGGYPQVGVIISADLDAVGQLLPGHSVAFEPVTLAEARIARQDAEDRWTRWLVMASIGRELRDG